MNRRWLRWAASLAHRPRAEREARLVVIRHHRVYAAGERPLYRLGVSAPVLEAQLAWLARARLRPVTVSQGLERLERGEAGACVALSFDDGYADNVARALPLLVRHGARATFFLAAGLIEERRAPWWDRLAFAVARAPLPRAAGGGLPPLARDCDRASALAALMLALRLAPRELEARLAAVEAALGAEETAPCELATWSELGRLVESGMEIGAHTLGHPFLSLLDSGAQRAEIEGSVALIARRLGVRPRGLAYPAGDYSEASVAAARAAGLEYAATTRAGDNRAATPRHELRRRSLSEGACLGPGGRFSARLARAELDGVFDRLRGAGTGA